MTVRATSNQTIKTVVRTRFGVTYEMGPGDDEGGRGFPVTTYTIYREVLNDSGSLGMVFTPGYDHLPEGTPQADRQPL